MVKGYLTYGSHWFEKYLWCTRLNSSNCDVYTLVSFVLDSKRYDGFMSSFWTWKAFLPNWKRTLDPVSWAMGTLKEDHQQCWMLAGMHTCVCMHTCTHPSPLGDAGLRQKLEPCFWLCCPHAYWNPLGLREAMLVAQNVGVATVFLWKHHAFLTAFISSVLSWCQSPLWKASYDTAPLCRHLGLALGWLVLCLEHRPFSIKCSPSKLWP